jgi:hypothetical protein
MIVDKSCLNHLLLKQKPDLQKVIPSAVRLSVFHRPVNFAPPPYDGFAFSGFVKSCFVLYVKYNNFNIPIQVAKFTKLITERLDSLARYN